VRKVLGVIGAAVLLAGLSPSASGSVATTQQTADSASSAATSLGQGARDRFSMRDRWAREGTHHGNQDTSVYDIDHVRELQYRLRWAGAYGGPVTGYFGDQTERGVRRFQRRNDLRVTGRANHKTWAELLHDTVRRRGRVPNICKKPGWHACYDRTVHQVTLWHKGRIHNTWLVRGGSSDHPTRKGNTHVYRRDKDHVSGLFGSPMPYSQFFDGGQAFHGSAAMMDPFSGHSHGCVNMYIEDARQLWRLTSDKYLRVTVYGRWS